MACRLGAVLLLVLIFYSSSPFAMDTSEEDSREPDSASDFDSHMSSESSEQGGIYAQQAGGEWAFGGHGIDRFGIAEPQHPGVGGAAGGVGGADAGAAGGLGGAVAGVGGAVAGVGGAAGEIGGAAAVVVGADGGAAGGLGGTGGQSGGAVEGVGGAVGGVGGATGELGGADGGVGAGAGGAGREADGAVGGAGSAVGAGGSADAAGVGGAGGADGEAGGAAGENGGAVGGAGGAHAGGIGGVGGAVGGVGGEDAGGIGGVGGFMDDQGAGHFGGDEALAGGAMMGDGHAGPVMDDFGLAMEVGQALGLYDGVSGAETGLDTGRGVDAGQSLGFFDGAGDAGAAIDAGYGVDGGQSPGLHDGLGGGGGGTGTDAGHGVDGGHLLGFHDGLVSGGGGGTGIDAAFNGEGGQAHADESAVHGLEAERAGMMGGQTLELVEEEHTEGAADAVSPTSPLLDSAPQTPTVAAEHESGKPHLHESLAGMPPLLSVEDNGGAKDIASQHEFYQDGIEFKTRPIHAEPESSPAPEAKGPGDEAYFPSTDSTGGAYHNAPSVQSSTPAMVTKEALEDNLRDHIASQSHIQPTAVLTTASKELGPSEQPEVKTPAGSHDHQEHHATPQAAASELTRQNEPHLQDTEEEEEEVVTFLPAASATRRAAQQTTLSVK